MNGVLVATVKYGTGNRDYDFHFGKRAKIVCTLLDGTDVNVWGSPSLLHACLRGDTVYLKPSGKNYKLVATEVNVQIALLRCKSLLNVVVAPIESKIKELESRLNQSQNIIDSMRSKVVQPQKNDDDLKTAIETLIDDLKSGNISFDVTQSGCATEILSEGDEDCQIDFSPLKTEAVYLGTVIRKHLAAILERLVDNAS